MPYSFVYFKAQKDNVISIFITNNSLLYLMIHIKFSSLFYSSQLSDMFAYELPFIGSKQNPNTNTNNINASINSLTGLCQPSVVVYNLHSLFFHKRVFIFSQHNHNMFDKKLSNNYFTLNSITELFPAGNWLERENSELHGINFLGKKDLRNLMLQYGDSSTPFNKSFPSIGTNELVYNPINDTISQVPISVQL